MPALVRQALCCVLSTFAVVLWTACGGGGGRTAGAGTFGYDERVEVPLLPLPFGLPEPGPAQWTDAFPGLLFDRPIAVVSVPGTDDLVVAEQRGRLIRFRNDPAVVAAYDADPLVTRGKIPAGLAGAMISAMQSFPERLPSLQLPVLVMHGSADALTDPRGSELVDRLAGSEDKTLVIYDDLFHEIFNEPERDVVLDEVVSWLERHTAH